jgi:hypothetical protein
VGNRHEALLVFFGENGANIKKIATDKDTGPVSADGVG